MTQTKALKTLIISLLIVSFTSVFSLLITNAVTCFHNPQVKADPPGYLEISTPEQLISFASKVNSGTTYNSQTVYLSRDIDLGGADFSGIGGGRVTDMGGGTKYRFDGKFNGNGYKIHNFRLTGYYYNQTRSIIGQKKYRYYYDHYIGLFINIGESAEIKNVKVSNFSYGITEQADVLSGGGHHRKYNYHYGGLISNKDTGGIVDSCYVEGPGSGFYGGSSITVSNTLVLNGSTPRVSGSNVFGSLSQSVPNLSGLNVSSVGGSSGTNWYYAAEYHSGWPIPRGFIKKWDKINFTVNISAAADSATSIYIPSDAPKIYADTTSELLLIYDQEVYAKKPNERYRFVKWTATDRLNYVANYELILISVTFADTVGDLVRSADKNQFTVTYGALITITTDYVNNTYTYIITENDGTVYRTTYDLSQNYEAKISNYIVEDNYLLTEDITISPMVNFKNYEIEFN